ncbi:MAG: hypothetical protein MJ016_02000 [Victivallaceae bacterium]|nr:hypothetical protein [Victivallaceae bacterium]
MAREKFMTVRSYRFTLVELLVVMGLIGLLVSLAAPAFSRINTGKAVNVGAEKLMRALEQAQALAVANRQYVGLIIPNGTRDYSSAFSSNDTPAFDRGTYNLASFRPAFVFYDDSSWKFDRWVPQSQWSAPMENARVVTVADRDSSLPVAGDDYTRGVTSVTGALSSAPAFQSLNGIGPCAVVFSPDGGLAATSDLFFVVQGCTVNNTTIDYTGNKTNYFILHVTRMGGKISYYSKQ